jgi:hypothetical protein
MTTSKHALYIPGTVYPFVRARQLEGTYPGDRGTGTWPSTSNRIRYGWGTPPASAWSYEFGSSWPPLEPPHIDSAAKQHRGCFYKRVRTIADCIEETKHGLGAGVSLDITDKWANPVGGKIPPSAPTDIVVATHFVTIEHYDGGSDVFRFRNSWGDKWGDQGYGYISRKDLQASWWEGWKFFPESESLWESLRSAPESDEDVSTLGHGIRARLWVPQDKDGSTIRWIELTDANDERLAWSSAVEYESTREIEEMFVRPEHRRLGLGNFLFQAMNRMSLEDGRSLRMWIPFADTKAENLIGIARLVGSAGLSIQDSGVRWAPFVAAPVWERRSGPVQKFNYPEKPPAIPSELVKYIADFLIATASVPTGTLIYDAIRSWLQPKNERRIRVKIGDVEVESDQLSVDEFKQLLAFVRDLKHQDEIVERLLDRGFVIVPTKRHK